MSERAERILEGPRGRMLCLDLLPGSEDLNAMRFDIAYELAPGESTAPFSLFTFGDGSVNTATEHESSGATPADFAALVRAAPRRDFHEADVREALEHSVAAAAYWQEPGGDDILAADPALRGCLLEVAERLVTRNDTQWWWRDAAAPQWSITWDLQGSALDDSDPDVDEWRTHLIAKNEAARIHREREPDTRFGGEWWSTPGTRSTIGRIPDCLSLVEDFHGAHRASVAPTGVPNGVYEIRAAHDWVALCEKYPLDVSDEMHGSWGDATGREGAWVIPDWRAVADEWSAVHLPVAGYLSCAGRALAVDGERASVIAGWSPDETYWLRHRVYADETAREEWARDDDDSWRQISGESEPYA